MLSVRSLILCPKTWKIFLLLEEHKIQYKIEHLNLNTFIKWPSIDKYHSDFSFILQHIETFAQSEKAKNMYGFWMNMIDFELIPQIIMQIRFQRVIRPIVLRETPCLNTLKIVRAELKENLKSISNYLSNNTWLDQDNFGLSDITLSSALATLDYLGEINWKDIAIKELYNWYLKVKSRPSFNVLLEQKCQGISAHSNFYKKDF